MYKFKFVDIGEGLHEGKVGEIFKRVGDTVKEGDDLFLVETDKVTTEIPSPVTGKIVWMSFKEGQTIHVGEEIYHFETADGEKNDTSPKADEDKKKDEGASVVGEVKVSNVVVDLNNMTAQSNVISKKVLSTPLARSLAAKMNIDINNVKGSGYNGRVLIADIHNFNNGSTYLPQSVNSKTVSDKRVKVTSMRKAIAKAMSNSWSNVAYTNLTLEVNMTSLWNMRKGLITDDFIAKVGTKVTFLPFIIKATTIAIRDFPSINAMYDQSTDEIVQYGNVHMGIAVDTPAGLVVPIVRESESKNIFELNLEIQSLAKKAREGKLSVKEMTGSTFTITNYGSAGALFGVPVINYPNVAILGVGAIIDKVYANENGSFFNGKAMHITIAADHRWIDGAEIGHFASKVKTLLENPLLLEESQWI